MDYHGHINASNSVNSARQELAAMNSIKTQHFFNYVFLSGDHSAHHFQEPSSWMYFPVTR